MSLTDGDDNSLWETLLSGIDVSKRLGDKCPDPPRSIEILIELVESALSFDGETYKIIFHPRNYQSKAIIGTVEAFEHEAHIYYDRNRNKCWRRMIIAKEMSHLLFAIHGEKHLANTPQQVEQLIDTILAGLEKIDLQKDHICSTEVSTLFMAVEILMPHSDRPIITEMLASGKSMLEIATLYRIPLESMKMYFHPSYIKLLDDATHFSKHKAFSQKKS